ncbi:MAG: hypothetical protein R3C49_26895 [Planctomycetaceae bacterium]
MDLSATGTLSLNGGLTTTPIDFSSNQTLVDDQGRVRHIDSTGIRLAGADTVQMTGSADLFAELRTLRDDLQNFSDFSASEWDAAITDHLGTLDDLNNHLLDVVGEQSVDLQNLDRLQTRAEDLSLEAQRVLGDLQGTDFTDAIIKLQEQTNLNQYTLASLAQVFQVSILDFLN